MALTERWKQFKKGEVGEKQENKHPIVANFIQGWLVLLYRKLRQPGEGAGGRHEVWEVPGPGKEASQPV